MKWVNQLMNGLAERMNCWGLWAGGSSAAKNNPLHEFQFISFLFFLPIHYEIPQSEEPAIVSWSEIEMNYLLLNEGRMKGLLVCMARWAHNQLSRNSKVKLLMEGAAEGWRQTKPFKEEDNTTTQLQSNQLSLCWFVGIDCCGNESTQRIL